MPTSLIRSAASFLALTVLVTGCAAATPSEDLVVEDGSSATTPESDSQPTPSLPPRATASPTLPTTVVDAIGNEVTISSIERIIPLDGTVTEVVFTFGLGDNVVAAELSATYPPEADALPEIGYQRALAAQAITIHSPTVLLAIDIAGPAEVIDDLGRLGYPIVIVPNDVGKYSSVAISSDGNPVISHYDATNGDLEFAKAYLVATGIAYQ